MSRVFVLAVLFAGLSMLVLPVLRADDGEWKTVKTKFVEFGKEELRSVVLRPGSLSGDQKIGRAHV